MKKLVSVILALALVLALLPAAFADLDLTNIKNNDTLFVLEVSEEHANTAYIESTITTKERSFEHVHEHPTLYSSTEFDILLANYGTADEYPVWRLWIYYCSKDGFLNIDSVDIIFNGKKYTYTGVAVENQRTSDKDGFVEPLLIKFGLGAAGNNLDMLIEMENAFDGVEDYVGTAKGLSGTLVLHGDGEDITVPLGYGFFIDFLIIKIGMQNIGGFDYLNRATYTPVTVTDVK